MENQYFRKEFVVWSRPDFRISLLVSQEMTAWILWFHILNCSRVETAWEYQWMVFKISADEPSLPHPQTWSWGWLCCCERLPRQVWCTGVAPPCKGLSVLGENGELELTRSCYSVSIWKTLGTIHSTFVLAFGLFTQREQIQRTHVLEFLLASSCRAVGLMFLFSMYRRVWVPGYHGD